MKDSLPTSGIPECLDKPYTPRHSHDLPNYGSRAYHPEAAASARRRLFKVARMAAALGFEPGRHRADES